MNIQSKSSAYSDPASELAMLTVQSGEDDRKQACAMRDFEANQQQSADAEQVDLMHEKATEIRTTAYVSGAMDIGSAACSFVSVGVGDSTSAGKDLSVGGKLLEGVGKFTGQMGTAATTDKDAAIAEAKSAGDRAGNECDKRKDDVKAADDFINKSLDFLRDWNSGSAQASQAALHRA